MGITVPAIMAAWIVLRSIWGGGPPPFGGGGGPPLGWDGKAVWVSHGGFVGVKVMLGVKDEDMESAAAAAEVLSDTEAAATTLDLDDVVDEAGVGVGEAEVVRSDVGDPSRLMVADSVDAPFIGIAIVVA